MSAHIHDSILAQYDYDVISSFDYNMHCYNTTYKYLLLPVYVGHTEFNHKIYNFYMNGQNGKVRGKTPKSPLKIALTVLFGLAVAAVAISMAIIFGG